MFKLKKKDDKKRYELYKCSYIEKNKLKFIKDCNIAFERFNFIYKDKSSTWHYRYYNITTLMVGSIYFYNFFKEFKKLIRKYSNTNKPLWYQAWLNFHEYDQVLDWHNHNECMFHGYISIDPKYSITEFKEFNIKNEPGNIYIGMPELFHRVKNLYKYEGKRITIGFDVIDEKIIKNLYKKYGKIDINLGFIPVHE
jgi:hypothetical protein